MAVTKRIVNALRGTMARATRPRPGQLISPSPADRWRDYPADGLTPSRLVAILRAADEGAVGQAMALFEQMEEKDAHLHAIAHRRRLAVTGLHWRIVSAARVRDGVDRSAADEAADYCREVMAELERFDEGLQHLSLALGRNVSVAEIVWESVGGGLRPVALVPVPFERITFDEAGQLRLLTEGESCEGMALPPFKFAVHTPHAVSGHPMRGGLLRVSALAYLGKHFAMKDWMVFSELFGMPVRVARYDASVTPEEKRELLRMLESLGREAAAIFSKAVEIQFLEAGRAKAPPPYENVCGFFNRELSKAWLGATLTVETSQQTGTLGAAQIHNEVRLDLRQDDLAKEARTIRRDLLTPMVRMRFGPDAPVPFFERQLDWPRELTELADVLKVAVNDLKMRVPAGWAHDVLGIPMAGEGDEPISGASS